MTDAMIAALGVIGAAMVGGIVTVFALLWNRIVKLEGVNRAQFLYTRHLIDHIYRSAPPPPPPPPPYIAELYERTD